MYRLYMIASGSLDLPMKSVSSVDVERNETSIKENSNQYYVQNQPTFALMFTVDEHGLSLLASPACCFRQSSMILFLVRK